MTELEEWVDQQLHITPDEMLSLNNPRVICRNDQMEIEFTVAIEDLVPQEARKGVRNR